MHDLKIALPDVQAQVETPQQERVFIKIRPLIATIHNFANEQICAPSRAPMKVVQIEGWELVVLIDLMEESDMIQLESALEARVTEECLSL